MSRTGNWRAGSRQKVDGKKDRELTTDRSCNWRAGADRRLEGNMTGNWQGAGLETGREQAGRMPIRSGKVKKYGHLIIY